MGYRTDFTLEVTLGIEGPVLEDMPRQLRMEEGKDSEFCWAISEDGHTEDEAKWYEWEEDMRRISLRHPDLYFHLHGEGEETGDIWDATFANGKAHVRQAEIVIAPFDPKKLS